MLVQTIDPEARAITHAARHDSDGFLAEELRRRAALRYPPFSHLIRVVCSAAAADDARVAASAVRAGLRLDGRSVLGPARLFRLRGRERSQLVIKASDRRSAIAAVGSTVQAAAVAHSGRASFSVDVDPQ